MKLNQLIECNTHLSGIEITGITCDSRKVKKGFAFVCIIGSISDGHDFAQTALEQGAAVIVAQRDLGIENQVIVEDTHKTFATMSANWFGNPSDSLKLIGVTGTNGKTSVTYMLKKIIESFGEKVGLVGTIQNMISDEIIPTSNTTPNAYDLNLLFSQMKEKSCTYVIMEVSSHALDQCRVYGLNFEVAMFTNLTQDHLDYHITMENYLEAKKKLFKMCKSAIINSDDEYAQALIEGIDCKVLTYSTGNASTFSAKAINYRPTGVEYELVGDSVLQHIKVNTGGKFTVYNSLCAVCCALELGFNATEIAKSLAELDGVKGRAEVVPCDRDFTIIIDYAHTPDGLKNILSTFRECKKNRVISLFGCGGDRDKTKRPIMGSIAARYSDFVIITSDNPRSENPTDIINDILVGLDGSITPYKVIENRIDAIKYAISIAQPEDIIVLAGKGHETYQILNSGTIRLDEREVVADALKEIKKRGI